MEQTIRNTEEKLKSSINKLNERLSSIIATGANPAILKNIEVEYYEVMTPLNQVANIKAPDATMLLVQAFDRTINKDIVEAIHKADLGLNPVDEGETVRIMVPAMTSDKREVFIKDAKAIGEEARISVRNVRTDANKKIKSLELSENEERLGEERIQKLVDEVNKEIEQIINAKVESLKNV